jgi:lipopolysaccharide/colanic/teichoic acid biosynthesis glycosyltransferase
LSVLHAAIREQTDTSRVTTRAQVPERLQKHWTWALVCVDVLAVLAASYIAGLPPAAGPATCVVVCGAMALCGMYRVSYAVRWYDEVYPVIAACALAFVPLWIVLHIVSGEPGSQPVVALLLSVALISLARAMLRLARFGPSEVPDATAAGVSPEAQWRVRHGFYPVWKFGFDVVLSAAVLLLASPIMLLAAVCIAIESGFPIFFRQERIGRDGTTFVIYKFRTMWRDAGPQWACPGDRRITNIGAWLRRGSIDELPQLFNVLRGEMSIVGPRPEMPEFAREFRRRIPHYDNRYIVRPGITGWAQVHAKRNLRPDEMRRVVPYDLFYVEHACPLLDAAVVMKTAAEFLFHRAV